MKNPIYLQYYYRRNGCAAKKSGDADCICWHDEGTGPYNDARHNDEAPLLEWRVKPKDS